MLKDENGKDHAVFSGDTLFIGDVGRPDLAIKGNVTMNDLAGMLYDSLQSKIIPLADDVIVYPAHGPGSSCGKNMSNETFSNVGNQKRLNYALQDMTRDEFIHAVTEGITPPPQYFAKDALKNKTGYDSFDAVMERNMKGLDVHSFKTKMDDGAIVIDTRKPQVFAKSFVKGSLSISLCGSYAVWVGTLIEDMNHPLLVVCKPGSEEESIRRLARVGYENVKGYLQDGFNSWSNAGMEIDRIEDLEDRDSFDLVNQKEKVLDVRKPVEYEAGHVANAENIPLNYMPTNLAQLSRDREYMVHCQTGYRSMIACSLMKSLGFRKVKNVKNGIEGLENVGVKIIQEEMAD